MKKYALSLVLIAIAPIFAASGYEYTNTESDSYTNVRPVKASANKTTVTSRKKGGYRNTITNNFYYTQPQYESSYMVESNRGIKRPNNYVRYNDNNNYGTVEKRSSRMAESYSSQMRKYFLAHPFFQPLKGKFGSVTDVAYAQNGFKFDILDGSVLDIDINSPTYGNIVNMGTSDLSGKQKTTQFLVKEDVSYGLSDTLSLVLMAQYDKTKVTFKDWSDGSGSDSLSDSGLNIFGIGIQNRFIDTDKWIGMVAGSYLHQKDTANIFLGELKAGYKIDRTTVYGLARLRYTDITRGDSYGAFVRDGTGDYLMLAYKTNTNDILDIEGGVGAFAVLNKDFTLNGELIYGAYDWHNQLSLRGTIGWQPGDMFALNLYAMTSLYDSADGKKKTYMNYDVNPDTTYFPAAAQSTTLVYTTGNYKIKDYNEWKIGLQAILYF